MFIHAQLCSLSVRRQSTARLSARRNKQRHDRTANKRELISVPRPDRPDQTDDRLLAECLLASLALPSAALALGAALGEFRQRSEGAQYIRGGANSRSTSQNTEQISYRVFERQFRTLCEYYAALACIVALRLTLLVC